MTNGSVWTEEHSSILTELAGVASDVEIVAELERRTGARFARMTILRRRQRDRLPNKHGLQNPVMDYGQLMQRIAKKLEHYSMPEPNSGCTLWLAGVNDLGYGVVSVPGRPPQMAYRMAYEVANGPIPKGAHICHKCDVPACINPLHLWAGTARENMLDRYRKGRGNNPRGEAHGRAKLTEAAVLEIRESRERAKVVAARFGVSVSQIYSIRHRERWSHISPSVNLDIASASSR